MRRAELDEGAGGPVADLRFWKVDPQLAPIRDGSLSDEWKQLWAEVEELLEDAEEALRR